jgi:Uma2 family endonuclease
MPDLAHTIIQHLLSVVFGAFLREHSFGIVGPELRCIFGPPGAEHARLPDFSFIAWEHLGADSWNGPHHGPPDLAAEELSPDDRPGEVAAKIAFYLMNGVRLVWLIDPVERTIWVFTPAGETRLLHDDDTLDGGDVLPGFSTPVRDILPPPGPLSTRQPAE